MKVRFFDRVEDSHPEIVEEDSGKLSVKYDVRRFGKGEVADLPEKRAQKLLNLGLVETVE